MNRRVSKCNVGIVDYGIAGNTKNVFQAILAADGEAHFIKSPKDFQKVDKIILPGVGGFKGVMDNLNDADLVAPLRLALRSKPTLAICVGMQILASIGFEHGVTDGLQVIEGEVRNMQVDAVLPHIGFSKICSIGSNRLLKGLDEQEFYFMHSFELINYLNVSALAVYHDHQFVAAVESDSIFGVQFHPEKSRDPGIQVFKNFVRL